MQRKMKAAVAVVEFARAAQYEQIAIVVLRLETVVFFDCYLKGEGSFTVNESY